MKQSKYNQIKSVLARTDKTIKDLAQLLGVNERTVSRWCTNSRQPSLETLYEVARVLKVHVTELLAPME
jgi:putative transcriptional regulator